MRWPLGSRPITQIFFAKHEATRCAFSAGDQIEFRTFRTSIAAPLFVRCLFFRCTAPSMASSAFSVNFAVFFLKVQNFYWSLFLFGRDFDQQKLPKPFTFLLVVQTSDWPNWIVDLFSITIIYRLKMQRLILDPLSQQTKHWPLSTLASVTFLSFHLEYLSDASVLFIWDDDELPLMDLWCYNYQLVMESTPQGVSSFSPGELHWSTVKWASVLHTSKACPRSVHIVANKNPTEENSTQEELSCYCWENFLNNKLLLIRQFQSQFQRHHFQSYKCPWTRTSEFSHTCFPNCVFSFFHTVSQSSSIHPTQWTIFNFVRFRYVCTLFFGKLSFAAEKKSSLRKNAKSLWKSFRFSVPVFPWGPGRLQSRSGAGGSGSCARRTLSPVLWSGAWWTQSSLYGVSSSNPICTRLDFQDLYIDVYKWEMFSCCDNFVLIWKQTRAFLRNYRICRDGQLGK